MLAQTLLATILFTGASFGATVFNVTLSGPAEAPPNASPGTGTALVFVDDIAQTMRLVTSFSGLTGTVTVAHIHCCTADPTAGTAGVTTTTPTFAGFPSGVTSGAYDQTFDMTLASSYNPAFITANGGTTASAFAVFLAGMNAGRAYLNIHTTTFGGGEIRGFLTPEPGTLTLLGTALAFAAALRFRKPAA